jgi:hypothetical protein
MWFLMNAALLTASVSSQANLAARAQTAMAYFGSERRPWFLCGSQQWLGDGATETMAEAWRNFYRQELARHPRNPSAAGRAELMQRAVELLGER